MRSENNHVSSITNSNNGEIEIPDIGYNFNHRLLSFTEEVNSNWMREDVYVVAVANTSVSNVEECRTDERPTKDIPPSNLLMLYASIIFVGLAATVLYTYTDDATKSQSDETDHDNNIYRHLVQLVLDDDVNIDGVVNVSQGPEASSFQEIHSKPLFPLDPSDYLGFLCATLGLMIAAGGGIGGGGILVPIYILVMGLSPKHAIPLSNVTIVGGAIANNMINMRKRHPLADRPLIDWDLVLVMVPLTLLGALLGAFLNKVLPELLLTILLVILLSITAYTTMTKAIALFKKETQQLQKAAIPTAEMKYLLVPTGVENVDETSVKDHVLKSRYSSICSDTDESKTNEIIQAILDEEKGTPVKSVVLLVLTLLVVSVVNLLKGGGAFRSPLGIECGSPEFWCTNAFLAIWILGIAWYFRHYLLARHHLKEANGYKYVEGDIKWDEYTTILYTSICCCAGFFAGMFGIGGGIITGPLILAMGVRPEVNSATSACMILFTALTALTSFIVFGLVLPDYAVVFFIIGFVATYAGHEILYYYMKKSNRNSFIAFSIGFVVLISACLMTIQSIISLVTGETGHTHGICSV